jgi:hypothetical protein
MHKLALTCQVLYDKDINIQLLNKVTSLEFAKSLERNYLVKI